jgi:hypothetical protein
MIFEKTRVKYANVFVNQLASVKFGIRKILNEIYIFRKFWIIGVENAKLQIFKGFLKPPETKKSTQIECFLRSGRDSNPRPHA